jgi:hypothetical protein
MVFSPKQGEYIDDQLDRLDRPSRCPLQRTCRRERDVRAIRGRAGIGGRDIESAFAEVSLPDLCRSVRQ